MMAETAKTKARWIRDGLYEKYIAGKYGIDIGCGRLDTFDGVDTISTENCVHHDKDMCDAHTMELWGKEEFDYVWASHILEHLENPAKAIRRWFELLKPGGVLMIQVPDRDLYEGKRMLPSMWNGDHKTMWTLHEVDPPNTFALGDVVGYALMGDGVRVLHYDVMNEGWSKAGPTAHASGEYSIEILIQKLWTASAVEEF